MSLPALLRRLGSYLRPYWPPCVAIVLALVVELGARSLLPLSLKFLIDYAIEPRDAGLLTVVLIGLAVVFIVAAIAGLLRDYLSARVGVQVLNDLRLRMWEHLQALPIEFYTRSHTGDIIARFGSDVSFVQAAVTRAVPEALGATLQVGLSAVFLISLDWRLGLIALLVVPAAMLGPRVFGSRATRASQKRNIQEGNVLNLLTEQVAAQVIVRTYGLQESGNAQFGLQLQDLARASTRASFLGRLTVRVSDSAQISVQLLVIAVGGYLAFHGLVSVGTLAAFVGLVFTMGDAVQSLSKVVPDLLEAAGGIQSVDELLARQPGVVDAKGATPLQPVSEIRFSDVSFGYDDDRIVLDNVSFTIVAGQTAAFVGRSGSGKSTILNLLTRLYDPSEGAVIISGQDLQDVSQASLRSQIGAVFQDSYLFNTSIRENIRVGRPAATDSDVEGAGSLAELHDLVGALPDGYDTSVGERGSRLSGGVRQRISLARAILRDPAVLVLDEPTSALDPETEAEINATLRRLARDRTIISVTHRLSAAAHADRIFVLDNGRVVEQGSHDDLLAQHGTYWGMWERQSGFVLADGGRRAEVHAERLRGIPLFAELDVDILQALADRFVSERLPEDRVIFGEGDSGDKFYLIARGTVEVCRQGPADAETLVAVLQDGDFFGEMALLAQVPRNATIRTRTACLLLSLDEHQFRNLLETAPQLRAKVEEVAAARDRENAALRGMVPSSSQREGTMPSDPLADLKLK